jgi:hypothetical protein
MPFERNVYNSFFNPFLNFTCFTYFYTNTFITCVWPEFRNCSLIYNVRCRSEARMAQNNWEFTAKECQEVKYLFIKGNSAKKDLWNDIRQSRTGLLGLGQDIWKVKMNIPRPFQKTRTFIHSTTEAVSMGKLYNTIIPAFRTYHRSFKNRTHG